MPLRKRVDQLPAASGPTGTDYIILSRPSGANSGTKAMTLSQLADYVSENGGGVGPTGPSGEASTVPGPTGPASTVPGPTGPSGPRGNDGAAGAQGDRGPTGPSGDRGADGSAGSVGATGPSGPKGDVGSTGPSGASVTGPSGPAGNPGATGPTGPAGSGGSSNGTKTYAVFDALRNQPPASSYAVLDQRNSVAVLNYDDSSAWSGVFLGIVPESASLGSGLIVRIVWIAASATSGNVVWKVEVERCNTQITSDSFDTSASATTATSGTNAVPNVTSITLTTIDGVTAGDAFRLRITRDSSNASDTMTGNAQLIAVEVRSAA